MNRVALTLALAALFAPISTAAVAAPAARSFVVTPDHHTVAEASFTSRAAIVRMVGRTSKIDGNATIDLADVAHSSGTVNVDLPSLDTGIAMRNHHMQGFLESDKFPKATFKFTHIEVPGNKLAPGKLVTGTATGTITIHGVSQTLSAPIELTYLPQEDAKYRAGDWIHFYSQFHTKVSDYKIALPAPLLGNKVSNDLVIEIDGMAKGQ